MSQELRVGTRYAIEKIMVDFGNFDARRDLLNRIRSSRDELWIRAVAVALVEAAGILALARSQDKAQFEARLRAQGHARVVPGQVRADGVVIPEIHLHIDAGAIQVQHTTHVDPGAVQLEVDAGAADMDVVRNGDGQVTGVRKV
jgi:hypothetical protein